eukprot:gene3552-3821_t
MSCASYQRNKDAFASVAVRNTRRSNAGSGVVRSANMAVHGPSFESLDLEDSPVMSMDQRPRVDTLPEEKDGYVLHPDLLNSRLLEAQYAVRGELYLRAEELKKEGKQIIYTNVGNPQALGAKPLTFVRQVIALCAAPFLLDDPNASLLFPPDAIERARKLLASFGTGGVGGYTDSRGNILVRSEVADFIQNGASAGVRNILQSIIRNEADAILVPMPQYPLYSASCALYGGKLLPYELDEARGWSLDLTSLTKQVAAARREGFAIRALVFINPGNPTGQCLSGEEVAALVKWCAKEHILLLADEVYQELVYDSDRPFVSAYKALKESDVADKCELISFHSVSKGTSGECGLRGGYFVLSNIHPGTVAEFYKLSSIGLCPNTIGQVVLSCLCNPPKPGDASYDLFQQERATEFASLARRAALVSDAFNSLPNMSVVPTKAAMYSFPQVHLPPGALAAAAAAGKKPDVFYCLRLLNEAHICTIPGSGFGQAMGTHHFRTTILPREEVMAGFVDKFKQFHAKFMEEFTNNGKQ